MAYKFELTKVQALRYAALKTQLADAIEKLRAAEDIANEKIAEIVTVMNQEIETFNAALAEARTFATEVHEEAQRQIAAKSARWQESEAGEAASEWQTSWENIDLTPVEVNGEVVVNEIDYGIVEEFEQLPESAGAG